MKKILLIISLLFCFTTVMALGTTSKYLVQKPIINNLDNKIEEKINITFNDFEKVIDLTYKIPDDYNKDTITIIPSLMTVLDTVNYIPNDGVKINLKIINDSNYDYEYRDYSFNISTYNDLEKIDNTIGFDNQKINSDNLINRTVNSAIQNLYGKKEVTKDMLSDNELDYKLRSLGYDGIGELNKFYLDYYNFIYGYSFLNLEDFNNSIITEILSGKNLDVNETNSDIIELGYNYFYNQIYSFHFNDKYNYKESSNYSIGSYMRDSNISNQYFKEYFRKIRSKNYSELNDMKLRINGNLLTNAFNNYKLNTYMELKLDKVMHESDDIFPPKTGI